MEPRCNVFKRIRNIVETSFRRPICNQTNNYYPDPIIHLLLLFSSSFPQIISNRGIQPAQTKTSTMKKSLAILAYPLLVSRITRAFAPGTSTLLPSRKWLRTRTSSIVSSSRLSMTTVVDDSAQLGQDTVTKKTPIILLAGFLGTGKTTTLKHLLENTEGTKIGVVVNDVASVNIDAKLVSSMPNSASEDMIELQNGCACCSLSDELFTSVETLFKPKNKNPRSYDAIVVELSGVADPMAIAATWKAAEGSDRFPATELANISKIVTMIDSATCTCKFSVRCICYLPFRLQSSLIIIIIIIILSLDSILESSWR